MAHLVQQTDQTGKQFEAGAGIVGGSYISRSINLLNYMKLEANS
jgi:hypothetical protein